MNEPASSFESAYRSFESYLNSLREVNAAMREVGIETINVDPHANFAEVIVARKFNGRVQPATTKGFDVLCHDGTKIQVKSLKTSSAKPEDNPLNWYGATRERGQRVGCLIDADLLAVVVYRDFVPYAQVITPVVMRDSFPVIEVKDLFIHHVDKVIDENLSSPQFKASRIEWRGNE